MKREGYLIEKIADYGNLNWAYWKAKRGKADKSELIAFGLTLESNLIGLQKGILEGTLKLGQYHYFKIFEPKERQICAASFSERVLHHAIMNVCHQSFEDFQVFDSYATRQSKGTWAAIKRAAHFHKKYNYYMKIDCRKYFDSIDHTILKAQLMRRFKDEKLLSLFYQIIDSYEVSCQKGLPIGNLTSQYFANHYLAYADRFLSQTLKVPAMVRYMDDLIIWHNNSTELKLIGEKLNDYCISDLQLTFKHQFQNLSSSGVSFLGIMLWKSHQTLNKKSRISLVVNYKKAQSEFTVGKISQSTYQQQMTSLMVRPLKVKSYGFRQQMLGNTNNREGPAGRQLLQQCSELPPTES